MDPRTDACGKSGRRRRVFVCEANQLQIKRVIRRRRKTPPGDGR